MFFIIQKFRFQNTPTISPELVSTDVMSPELAMALKGFHVKMGTILEGREWFFRGLISAVVEGMNTGHPIAKSLICTPLKGAFNWRVKGFTLIELLVVIAIIAILAGLLMPVLSRAKNRGIMMTDLNNFRQLGMAMHLYAADSGDSLPWPNWYAGDVSSNGIPRTGWLYKLDTTVKGSARFKAQTGLFWSALRDPRMYMCPMDYTNTALFAQRAQKISSYVMNGAVIGYNRMIFPCVNLSSMAPEAVAFWETDETEPKYFNDGASYPKEGVSARHLQGAINGAFDGSASFIKFDTWYDEVDQTNKNQLWCYPNSPDGR
jgi:prepilin-type N-terminal cleavage/methylation domain-containing protein